MPFSSLSILTTKPLLETTFGHCAVKLPQLIMVVVLVRAWFNYFLLTTRVDRRIVYRKDVA